MNDRSQRTEIETDGDPKTWPGILAIPIGIAFFIVMLWVF